MYASICLSMTFVYGMCYFENNYTTTEFIAPGIFSCHFIITMILFSGRYSNFTGEELEPRDIILLHAHVWQKKHLLKPSFSAWSTVLLVFATVNVKSHNCAVTLIKARVCFISNCSILCTVNFKANREMLSCSPESRISF